MATTKDGGEKRSALLGHVIESRYTLEAKLSLGDESREPTTWRATDGVLARPVVIRIAPGARAGTKLHESASAYGSVRQASLAHVLDTVKEGSRGIRGVVREWVEAVPLLTALTQSGLRREESVTLIRSVAEALQCLHSNGLAHGHLIPANIFIRADGRVVVTDPGLRRSQDPRATSVAELQRQDLLALSDLIHLVLSGTWPGQHEDARGIAATARDVNGPLSPRQVRAGVAREMDVLWARAAHAANTVAAKPFANVAELLEVVSVMPSAPLGSPEPEPERSARVDLRWSQTLWGKRLRRSSPYLALAGLGVIGWVLGLTVGALPGQNHTGATTTANGAAASGPSSKPARVTAFDPAPGDGSEDNAKVPLAYDGDTSTVWETDTYQGSPRLGGIKQGVGLRVDLGGAVTVKTINLTMPLAGQSFEIRASDTGGTRLSDYTVVATSTNAKTTVSLQNADRTPHRYWLIWITSLPKVDGGFRGGVSEFAFLR